MSNFHPNNKHSNGYDFTVLVQSHPELQAFIYKNKHGITTIDFTNPQAVKSLNTALLVHYYHISSWDIPEGYLCPPIPSRADYIHHLADLLPPQPSHRLLDIGAGANCIYPVLGSQLYAWSFVGVDIDEVALKNAQKIIRLNPCLQDKIELRKQSDKNAIFKGVVQKSEYFSATLCNPPFYRSFSDAEAANQRKWHNLGKQDKSLNFGGIKTELICDGGEVKFIIDMMYESRLFSRQCLWFTSLVAKDASLIPLHRTLKRLAVQRVETIEMNHGNKKSHILAWSFFSNTEQQGSAKRQIR